MVLETGGLKYGCSSCAVMNVTSSLHCTVNRAFNDFLRFMSVDTLDTLDVCIYCYTSSVAIESFEVLNLTPERKSEYKSRGL